MGPGFRSNRCIKTGLPCYWEPEIELQIGSRKPRSLELKSFVINFMIISISRHHDKITRSCVIGFLQFLVSGPLV